MCLLKRHRETATVMLFVLCCDGAIAQPLTTARQALTIGVMPIVHLRVSGNPGPLIINDVRGGPATVSDGKTSYSIAANIDHLKIVASLKEAMPKGTQLLISMKSSKGISRGVVDISSALSPVDVVTGIRKGAERDQAITYTFAAGTAAGEIESGSRVVVLTLTE